jgi:hypothetical protein
MDQKTVDKIIKRLHREEEHLWSTQKSGENETAPGVTRAIQIIRSM